ncbi:peptidase domain-containing ABC transporter [Spartinivicinus poritis]|uniref:Peptidase domain-containing ABC transporter n=1 Tax=Spartinivicinus poritis TaxID=2994640 RepID=A0ABT5UGC8_9GAMM|nr:peptidase domain-containing ABC transporter [Spartinivicinus sp. A2-2]MDE1465046.1 peptidase domain-containing ABC transporter [Spartinivicinus sp. A2-2]
MSNVINLLNFKNKNTLPVLYQTETAECGLICLAMILNYYGHKIDINSLREKYSVSQHGANLAHISQMANKLKFTTRPVRVELEHANKLKLPCIVHWNLNHYVVLCTINKKYAIVHDPAYGKRKITIGEFSKSFTGVALEITPNAEFTQKNESIQYKISILWGNIEGLKRSLFQVFLLSVFIQLFFIVLPYFLQLSIDKVLVTNDKNLLTVLGIGFLFLILIKAATTAFRSWVIIYLRSILGVQLVSNLLNHMLRLPLIWFEKRHMGDIVSRFGSLDKIKQILSSTFIESLVDGIISLTTLVLMFLYSSVLGFIALLAILLYASYRFFIYHKLRSCNEERIRLSAKENSIFMESVRAIQPVKIFRKENTRVEQWQTCYADVVNAEVKLGKLEISYNLLLDSIKGFEYIAIIWVGVLSIINGNLTIGMLYAFLAYRQQFSDSTQKFIDQIIEYRLLELHLTRIGDIALAKEEKHLDGYSKSPTSKNVILELNDVWFRYSSNDPYILKNINLKVFAGERIAIVAPSGFGKTTLLKIMMGLIEPTAGSVHWYGEDIRHVGLLNYRNNISAVMQDDKLLSGTIGDNICFFSSQPDAKLMHECAESASILQDISKLPMGFKSLVGDMGTSLSGGQIQRLLLARALYQQPEILFLDEATSHLDINTEANVNNALKSLNVTRIFIAHRKESIALADRVIDLRDLAESSNNSAIPIPS